jgi:catechol-2,3-dioxygenase
MHIPAERYDAAVTYLREQGQEVIEQAFGNRGRALYVNDPDGNVVEMWTWDVGEHLTSSES